MDIQGHKKCQAGQAMVEYLIVLPLLILLGFGTLQFALIWHAKTTLNYAAFQTARAGSVNNASLVEMQNAFARNMAPMHTHQPTAAQVRTAKNIVLGEIQSGYVWIQIINPSAASFADHGLVNADGRLEIPNDNLMYRNAVDRSGGASLQTVQDANLLKIHVSYCYELHVPVINNMLVRMMSLAPGVRQNSLRDDRWNFGTLPVGSFAESCVVNPADAGRLGFPLYTQAIMRMQSPAIQ